MLSFFASKKGGVITAKTLKKYSKVFLQSYKSIVNKNITIEKYREYFDLYRDSPYNIQTVISKKSGASIEFAPSKESFFTNLSVDIKIEDHIFKDINLRYTNKGELIEHAIMVFQRGLEGAMIGSPEKNIYTHFEFITNDGFFIELLDEKSSILLKEVIVDNVHFPNYVLLKGSFKKNMWAKANAKTEALWLFDFELNLSYFRSVEFRKFLANPHLSELADQILEKEQNGIYSGAHGALSFDKDLMKLKSIAQNHNIPAKFTDIVLETKRSFKNRKTWYQKHPIWTGMIGASIVTILSYLLKIYGSQIFEYLKSIFE